MRHKLFGRIGRFVILKSDLDELPDWLQQLMARVIVLRADFSFEQNGVEYLALSPEFDVVLPSCFAADYRPHIENGRFLRWQS